MSAGRSLKVAIIRQRYTPYGGAERFVERALSALGAKGAEATVICREWVANGAATACRPLICNPSFRRWLGGRSARDRSFAAGVGELLARESFDIVQSHERIPGVMIYRAGDGVHAAWLDHLRRARGAWGRLGLSLSSFHRYVLGAEKAMYAHPDLRAVICNSRLVQEELKRYYEVADDKLVLIPNGIDLDAFSPEAARADRAKIRADLGLKGDDFAWIFVGNGFERKGVFRLLAALAQAQAGDQRQHLLVLGSDRKISAAEKLADQLGVADRVHWLGNRKDVRPYLGAADAFALPTLYDPCPNAALEALACGLPVLTSTACGAAELLTVGVNGEICDALDIDAIVGAMGRMAAIPGSPEQIQAARAAVADLSLTRLADRLLSLYQDLSGATQGAGNALS